MKLGDTVNSPRYGLSADMSPPISPSSFAATMTLDANHPLTGENLTFDLEVVEVA